MKNISFNEPSYNPKAFEYMQQAVEEYHEICGDGVYTRKCSQWLEERFNSQKILLTTSGTTALDMAAVLINIKPGDEVILSSFTFSSTATAFVMRGAVLVFVDIRPDTMNIDEKLIEDAITEHTRAIVVTHYAGVACEMNIIMEIAKRYNLYVIEDAAHAPLATYYGRQLGTIGDIGCFSFHETKNYSMGEGGAISINNKNFIDRAEIIREKGTNRTAFYRGQVAKYNWIDIGDSYLPSDLLAAYLWAQLEVADKINARRINIWNQYNDAFKPISKKGLVTLPTVPEGCVHNAHMYYLKFDSLETRSDFIKKMKEKNIQCTFHYVPLHSAPAGLKFGRFHNKDHYITRESDKLVRLPMHLNLMDKDVQYIIENVYNYIDK